jgi:Cu+-exporting ATPase
MAMSSVSVVTNALRLRRFRRPASADEILHPPLVERVREHAYLAGIALVALAAGAGALALARPEHRAGAPATAGVAGTAGMAGMAGTAATPSAPGGATPMPSMSAPVSPAEAGVRAELAAPAEARLGEPIRLVYRLADAATGAPLTDVVVSHEQPLHLIAVRRDLSGFQHVHPQPTGVPGEYALDVAFPAPGEYLLFAELQRGGGQTVLLRDTLPVGDATPAGAPSDAPAPAPVAEDRAPKVLPAGGVAGGLRVALQGTGHLHAGESDAFTFRLEEAATGEPLRDLRPYLGAPAHVVILSADGADFVHTHGEVGAADASPAAGMGHAEGTTSQAGAAPPDAFGPEIAFHHTFPRPGLYKVWGQFQTPGGEVVTADFVVRAGSHG